MQRLSRKYRKSHVYGLLARLTIATALYAAYCLIVHLALGPIRTWVSFEMWQLLPREALDREPWTSVWLLHGQPPAMNFLLAILYQCAGGDLNRLHGLATMFFHLVGWGVCWIWLELAWRMTRRLGWAILLVALLLVNPAFHFFQYQYHYPHLLLLETGLILLALERWARRPNAARLAIAVAALALLVYTRSLWHPVVAAPMLGIAGLHLWRRFGSARLALRQCAIAALVFAALVAPWMIKNKIYFNTADFSSWMGLNLKDLGLGTNAPWEFSQTGEWDEAVVLDYYSKKQLERFEGHPALNLIHKQPTPEKVPINLNHYSMPALSAVAVRATLEGWKRNPRYYWDNRLSNHIAMFDTPPYYLIYSYDLQDGEYAHQLPSRWKTIHDHLYYLRGLRGLVGFKIGYIHWRPTPWYLIVPLLLGSMAWRARRIRGRRGLLCAAMGGMYLWLTLMLLFVDGHESGRMRWHMEPMLLLMAATALDGSAAAAAVWASRARRRLRGLWALARGANWHGWRPPAALAAITLAAIFVREGLGNSIAQPFIFTDEIWHIEYARSILDWQGLRWNGRLVAHPNWLYPLFLAPWLKVMEFMPAYRAMLWSNSVAMALTLPLTYALARRYVAPGRALLAAALTALPVAMGYTATLMAENLWMPAGMLTAIFMLRAMERPRWGDCIAAGLLMGLMYHIKPHGLFYPPLFALAVFAAEGLLCTAGRQSAAQAARRIGMHTVTGAAWLTALSPRFVEAAVFEHNPRPFSLDALFGSYAGRARGDFPFDPTAFLFILLANITLWAFAVGFIPAWSLARRWRGWRALDTRRLCLIALTSVMSAFFILMSARHTVIADPMTSVYERYLMIVFPLLFVVLALPGIADPRAGRAGARRWPTALKWILPPLAAGIAVWLAVNRFWFLHSNMPSLAGWFWLRFPENVEPRGWVILLTLAAGGGLLVHLAPTRPLRGAMLAGLLMVAMNIGWYGAHNFHTKPGIEPEISIARKVLERTPRDAELWTLRDGIEPRVMNYVTFYNNGRIVTLDHENRSWLDDPLALNEHRAVTAGDPARTWLLAHRSWAFDRPAVKRIGDLALYELGSAPLIFEGPRSPEELVDPDIPPTIWGPPGASRARETFEGIEVDWLNIEQPETWRTGRVHTVELRLRNAGELPWPGHLAVGYHWSNHPLTGSYDAVVWDDGHAAALPELEPGQTATIRLRIATPATPHPEWDLILNFKLSPPGGSVLWDTQDLVKLLKVSIEP